MGDDEHHDNLHQLKRPDDIFRNYIIEKVLELNSAIETAVIRKGDDKRLGTASSLLGSLITLVFPYLDLEPLEVDIRGEDETKKQMATIVKDTILELTIKLNWNGLDRQSIYFTYVWFMQSLYHKGFLPQIEIGVPIELAFDSAR